MKHITENPVVVCERESARFTVAFPWITAAVVDASSLIVYRGTNDVTATVAAGSNTYSGNAITLKTLSGLTAGQTYKLSILVELDGVDHEYQLEVYCASSSDKDRGTFLLESPVIQGERAEVQYSVSFGGSVVTADASTALKVYKGTTDVTSTVTSGSNSVSGSVVTTKVIKSLVKGRYICSLLATVDGIATEVKWQIDCFSSD